MDVTNFLVAFRRRNAIAFQPALDVEQVNLFSPQHAGESTPLNQFLFLGRLGRMNGFVELVRLFFPLLHHFVHVAKWIGHLLLGQAQPKDDRTPTRHLAR